MVTRWLSYLVLSLMAFMGSAVALQEGFTDQDLKDSVAAANQWLSLVDSGHYPESWDAGAVTFKFTITRPEWTKAMEKLRQPLGTVTSRELLEQRTAKDPKGLPAGEYMVLYYKTAFSNRPDANELITEVKESDGKWRVLTYHAR
jgi:hypothetical protein